MNEYVSSVDSGNLCASLMCVLGAINDVLKKPILGAAECDGMADVICDCTDFLPQDYSEQLNILADELYTGYGYEGYMSLKRLLSNAIISSKEELSFATALSGAWIEDYERLSFDGALLNKVRGDIRLKRVAELVESFPKSIDEIANENTFYTELNERVKGISSLDIALLDEIKSNYQRIYSYAYKLKGDVEKIAQTIVGLLENTDFSYLYSKKKNLLYIGSDGEKTSENCYDMLMSEARLTAFIAIALNKIPSDCWFSLDRALTRVKDTPLSLSWSGTMFEYLMPDIFIKPNENTLLYASQRLATQLQSEAPAENGIWGVSESAVNKLDSTGEYKYKANGIEALAISEKNDMVYAPYATMLALEYMPRECMDNIIRMVENGLVGKYGFYEAYDAQSTDNGGIVKEYMAHHQGMSLCALTNYLYSGYLRKSFAKNKCVSGTSVLLDEKLPIGVERLKCDSAQSITHGEKQVREIINADSYGREEIWLGDGILAKCTSKGEIKVYRGDIFIGELYLYITSEKTRSIGYLPARDNTVKYDTVISTGTVIYKTQEKAMNISASVCCEGNTLLIDIAVENKSREEKTVRLTAVLVPALNDEKTYFAHKAFNGLMLEAGFSENAMSLKNRKNGEAVYLTSSNNGLNFQTEAVNVIGRGRSVASPKLDFSSMPKKYPIFPCVASTQSITVAPEKISYGDFILCTERNRLANRASIRLFKERCENSAESLLCALGISFSQWQCSLKLLAMANSCLRASRCVGKKEILWRFGISDRCSLCVLEAGGTHLKDILNSLSVFLRYQRDICVIVLDDTVEDYLDGNYMYNERIIGEITDKGSIKHIKMNCFTAEELKQLKGMCFAWLNSQYELSEQLASVDAGKGKSNIRQRDNGYAKSKNDRLDGEYCNGYGCFTREGYYIFKRTPLAWANVLANESFGTIATESGGGYTWAENSQLNKLSSFSNDVVSDNLGEVLLLRDNELNQLWSITREPQGRDDEHDTLFGKGYVEYRYNGFGLAQKQTVFVYKSVKVINVSLEKLRNRDITCFFGADTVLGENKEEAYKYLKAYAYNGALVTEREGRYMFLYADNSEYCDSAEGFIGNGTILKPQCAFEGEFVNTLGITPFSALKVKASEEFNIFLGYARDKTELDGLLCELKSFDFEKAFETVREKNEAIVGCVTVETPDKRLNTLFPYLMYQTVTARMYGRTGMYQAGGAYGFRDQLQDCLAVIYYNPHLVREHLLRCAAHQFIEGDVQHWWHEGAGGVRTRISDDLLFLPYVTAKYVSVTGDKGVLDEAVPYLEGHQLFDRADLYEAAWQSRTVGTLYEHCIKAIKLVIGRSGKHHLPLMLFGDWNDGMNNVGKKGNGESVWLGWFLYSVISDFLPYCNAEDKALLTAHAAVLYKALNDNCWEGDRFLRAFDDDGKRVGSATSGGCKIDIISQSWAVLSGAGKPEYCARAMQSVREMLCDESNGIIKLLTPPLEKADNLGYICSYVPGVRENGGQYTHGALWAVQAFTELGETEYAYRLLEEINPINRTLTENATEKYGVEPFVLAADVYSNEDNVGHGGWTWYTASASLFFCTVLNKMLGVDFENGEIKINPHIPSSWREYSVKIKNGKVNYEIIVINPDGKNEGVASITRVNKGDTVQLRVVM